MAGNVWEWTRSEYTEGYPYQPELEDADPNSSSGRVLRGGSWSSDRNLVRVSYRLGSLQDFRESDIGFRVVI